MPAASSPSSSSSNDNSREDAHHRTWVLRVIFVVSLLAAAAVCALVSFFVMTDLEHSVGTQTYESVATSALEGAQSITLRKVQGGQVLASVAGYQFSSKDDWPSIAMDGYVETGSKIAELSGSVSVGLIVLVEPEQVQDFEAHALQVYRDQDLPETAGQSDFGFGIWQRDPNPQDPTWPDKRLPDTTGETSYDSPYTLLAPILQHNRVTATSLMYNVHSNVFRGRAIDSILDCTAQAQSEYLLSINATNATTTTPRPPFPECQVVTDLIELVIRPGPAALLYGPIYAAEDPFRVVGLTGTSIHWEEVLTNVVPDYVTGLDCVVSIPQTNTSFTYVMRNGVPEFLGQGDLHDPTHESWKHTVVLNDIQTGATTANMVYTLTVYPSEAFFAEFHSNSPLAIALGFMGVILFCAALFFGYDFFMRGESRERKMILEIKRRFVRFISHEIRTPLNTVCMGLELMRSEIESQQLMWTKKEEKPSKTSSTEVMEHQDNGKDAAVVNESAVDTLAKNSATEGTPIKQQKKPQTVQELFDYLLELTNDISDNSESAVAILNDLLNYDKIETGTFALEFGVFSIWHLARKTTSNFHIQAKNRHVALNFSLDVGSLEQPSRQSSQNTHCSDSENDHRSHDLEWNQPTSPNLDSVNMIGDSTRVRQILSNLISNCLKFVKEEEGVIDVVVAYVPDGLADAKPVLTKEGKPCCTHPRKGSVRISVTDNGEGMTKEQTSQLFNEGVQFDANRLQAGGGSGLGLYITKGLVEGHGGTIGVHSDGQSHGSTFTVEFPLYEVPLPKSEESAAGVGAKIKKESEPAKHTTHRILVVDDALLNRKMLIRLLERDGHTCDSAANGQEAVEAYIADKANATADGNHVQYDTILMDSEMPVLNGPDATQKLRELGCKALIAGVTGNVLVEDKLYFQSKGADLVLGKPLQVSALDEAWRSN